MTGLPNSYPQGNRQQGMYAPPPLPPRRWRFRWGWWVIVPLTCLATAWFLSGIETGFSFEEVMAWLNVHDQDRYRRLTVLCVLGTAIVLLVKVCRSK